MVRCRGLGRQVLGKRPPSKIGAEDGAATGKANGIKCGPEKQNTRPSRDGCRGERSRFEESGNLAAQPVAEGPQHQGAQADRGDVGRGLGDGGDGVDAVADLLEAEEAAEGQRVGKLLHGSGLVGNICHHPRSVVSSPQMSATEVMNLAKQLPEMEVLDLARMLEAWTAAMVDQKFEAAVKSGAFDQMAADALHELEAGKTIPLDEVLHDPRLS